MSNKENPLIIEIPNVGQVSTSIKILEECMRLQALKGNDYQSDASTIVQADYYPTGVKTIHEILHAKMLRAKSLIDAFEHTQYAQPNFESIEDTFKDLINYASFAVAYCRNGINGQDGTRDMLNRTIPIVEQSDEQKSRR